jgi:hypothetical protein
MIYSGAATLSISDSDQLLEEAYRYGLFCGTYDNGDLCIKPHPESLDWELVNHSDSWVLIVRGTPQIRFQYPEAARFITRVCKTLIQPSNHAIR